METVFIELPDNEEFVIYYKKSGAGYRGSVYPIVRGVDVSTSEEQWSFTSKQSSDTLLQLSDDCRVLFEFSLCWRGVWESRLNFVDVEYWGEELQTMFTLWNLLEEVIKVNIRNDNPTYDWALMEKP